MATLANNNPTLADWAQSLDPDGQIATVIELLNQTNEVLADITFSEGNLITGHRTTIRTGLPGVTWRRLYGGVQPDKSRRTQVTESTGMLEAYNEVDKALADLESNAAQFRLTEAQAQLEAFSQTVANTMFYGDTEVNQERFTGFAPRYDSLSAENADNIIDAGGTGSDNRSIWLVVWGPMTCHGIVPKGSQAGLQVTDKGQVTIEDVDGNGGRMEAYRMHFRWDLGLCVKDWRYVVRIANIDKSELNADASGSSANLPSLMFEAMELIPSMNAGRSTFYMSRDVRTKFRQQMANQVGNSTLDFKDVGGHRAMMYQDTVIRRCDALAIDEARII